MKAVFADASYWIALLNPGDSLHAKALTVSKSRAVVRTITSEMVLTEFLDDFSGRGRPFRQIAVGWVHRLRRNPNVVIVPQSSLQFQDALVLYAGRSDKDWGLTDCSSFQIMIREGLTEVLSHDKHFEQAGFQALLRS
jgi:uncharacterized protein